MLVWLLSVDPIARAIALAVASSCDGVLLDLGIRGAGGRRLLFGVKSFSALAGDLARITVEPFAQFIAPNGATDLAEPAEGADLDLVADPAGELRILIGGRVRVAVPVTARSIDRVALGVRFVSTLPIDSRPTVPDLFAA